MWQTLKSRLLSASIVTHQADAAAFYSSLEGDTKAARKLIASLSPKAHALAWRILGDSSEAEDIVQLAFIKLFEAKQYDGKAALSTYLHTIGGCTEFCVNGLMAGNRRTSRTGYDLKHKESSTQRSHR